MPCPLHLYSAVGKKACVLNNRKKDSSFPSSVFRIARATLWSISPQPLYTPYCYSHSVVHIATATLHSVLLQPLCGPYRHSHCIPYCYSHSVVHIVTATLHSVLPQPLCGPYRHSHCILRIATAILLSKLPPHFVVHNVTQLLLWRSDLLMKSTPPVHIFESLQPDHCTQYLAPITHPSF